MLNVLEQGQLAEKALLGPISKESWARISEMGTEP
jgi:hypothetical protein